MADKKMIANIFTDFRDLYNGKNGVGIAGLYRKYGRHPMMMGLLSHLEEAADLDVPQAMKEIYAFYKEYRGRELTDQECEAVVERTTRMVKARKENAWYRRVLLEVINLIEDDMREQQRIAAEVEKEMEAAARETEQEAA